MVRSMTIADYEEVYAFYSISQGGNVVYGEEFSGYAQQADEESRI